MVKSPLLLFRVCLYSYLWMTVNIHFFWIRNPKSWCSGSLYLSYTLLVSSFSLAFSLFKKNKYLALFSCFLRPLLFPRISFPSPCVKQVFPHFTSFLKFNILKNILLLNHHLEYFLHKLQIYGSYRMRPNDYSNISFFNFICKKKYRDIRLVSN